MITEKLQNAINEQITAEMWSSNLYLAMSFFMDKEGYCGMASWLKKQAHEEHEHACELASYIIKRFRYSLEVFEQVYEQIIKDKIDVVPRRSFRWKKKYSAGMDSKETGYEHECSFVDAKLGERR